jgi:hypothetical protein
LWFQTPNRHGLQPGKVAASPVVGVPLTAAAGWLLAGREPAAIARPVIE